MDSIVDRVIRCLCCCLIKKQVITYNEVNDEHSKFVNINEHIEENYRDKNLKKQYQQQLTTSSISNKLTNFLEQNINPLKKVSQEQHHLIKEQKEDEVTKLKQQYFKIKKSNDQLESELISKGEFWRLTVQSKNQKDNQQLIKEGKWQLLIAKQQKNRREFQLALISKDPQGQSLIKLSEGQRQAQILSKQSHGFENVISPTHPYFHLFKEKLYKLKDLFNIPSTVQPHKPSNSQFPISLSCYPQGKVNIFVYTFTFPTDFDTYQSISNNFELQAKFDDNIQIFRKQLQMVGDNSQLIYLAYKKILIISSRDFAYVKYSFKKDHQHWSICVSDPQFRQEKGRVRGQIVLTATRIIEVEGSIEVSVYSEINMKMPIKFEMARQRGYSEIKKYLDRVYAYIKSNKGNHI